ncbi:MAG: hypothetical protein WBQ24_00395, partial [Xanthobacteraceae bacterium]
DMHFFKNALRAAPWSFWSSAPKVHVANLSLALTAKDGLLGNIATGVAISIAEMKAYRRITRSPDWPQPQSSI